MLWSEQVLITTVAKQILQSIGFGHGGCIGLAYRKIGFEIHNIIYIYIYIYKYTHIYSTY